MIDSPWTRTAPAKILLATDLSCRCDRALDRAAQLGRQWGARLHVLHVLDPHERFLEVRHLDDLPTWRRPADRARVVEAQVRRDLLDGAETVEVSIETGDPAVVIDQVARAQACDLIVTGVARDETLGRYFLGATVDKLVRRTPVPLLVVKSRVRPYDEVLVATDFSDSSRHALNAAARFFPETPLTLLHAFEVPFARLLDKGAVGDQFKAVEREACDAFIARSELSHAQRRRLTVLVEHGSPEVMIRTYMRDRDVRLVVLGSHGRSAAFDVLIGSTAKRILETAPGDVLLIREPKAVDVK